MTTIHYTPPPDDAPERVLVWCPDTPGWWIGHSSDFVRRYWGRLCTAWKEQGPLPTPEPEPVPLEVGMKVQYVDDDDADLHGAPVSVLAWGGAHLFGVTDDGEAEMIAIRCARTLDGRPVCLPDEPDPVDPLLPCGAWILDGSCQRDAGHDGPHRHMSERGVRIAASRDLHDESGAEPEPGVSASVEAYTPEQIERAMRPYYHDKHIEWVLAALRDGEGE